MNNRKTSKSYTKMRNEKGAQFITNSIYGEDSFDGKSHESIAEVICNTLVNSDDCRIIGIEGGWGSGKSNLVEIIERKLEKSETDNTIFKFFIYDAWGHQEDLQRRSILEELTEDLTTGDGSPFLKGEKWKEKLELLLSKSRKTRKKTIPKLSCGIIISGIAVITTPILGVIADGLFLIEKGHTSLEPSQLLWKALFLSIPILGFILYIIGSFLWLWYKKRKFLYSIKRTLSRLFYIYNDATVRDCTTHEIISEGEPSTRHFRNWIKEIDDDLKSEEVKKKLILVFDNMDRLPNEKIQELWSSIHAFFAEVKYSNIKIIIPFDRENIKSAFKKENIESGFKKESPDDKSYSADAQCYGNDFINKTFNVVYRVSPPILSDWKKYFEEHWEKAFGEPLNDDGRVIQIYDLLTKDQTPRKIIAFINEFVSIKQLFKDQIPNKYIALFILGKDKINKKPNSEILKPNYLGALDFLYRGDKDLPKYISSLYYQLPPDKALDTIYTDKLTRALNDNDPSAISEISVLPSFRTLLDHAVTMIVSFENAAEALNSCFKEENGFNPIWECLYEKIKTEDAKETRLKNYQKILLNKLQNKDVYLKQVIDNLANKEQGFSSIDYYKDIYDLSNSIQGITPFDHLNENEEEDMGKYIQFIDQAKNDNQDYKKYKIKCDFATLDHYLSGYGLDEMRNLNIIPIIKNEYKFNLYKQKLLSLIVLDVSIDSVEIIFTRLKELGQPVDKGLLTDVQISDLYQINKKHNFHYDLLCMCIAKFKSFPSSYVPSFTSELNSEESNLLNEIAARIEYYVDYDELLLKLPEMNYPLYKKLAKELTENEIYYKGKHGNVFELLKKFDMIIAEASIDPVLFVEKLNNFSYDEMTQENIKDIPESFFDTKSTNKNELFKRCSILIKKHLGALSKDDWKSIINSTGREFKILKKIQYNVQYNYFEALKEIINDDIENYTKENIQESLRIVEKHFKLELGTIFKVNRDHFCNSKYDMTSTLFSSLGEWLFKYGDLSGNKKSIYTIFNTSILDEEKNRDIISQHSAEMKKIINIGDEYSAEFTTKVKDLVSKDPTLKDFATSIGIEIPDSVEETILPTPSE